MRIPIVLFSASALVSVLGNAACARGLSSHSTEAASPRSTSAAVPGTLSRALQLVVFVAPDWTTTLGTLRRFERPNISSPWTPVDVPIPAVVGRTGLAWSDSALASAGGQPVKHEGDGKSPAGAFPLDTAFGFAPRPDMSWLHLPYVPLVPGSECVDDEASTHYNTVVDRASVKRVDWTSAEHMRQVGQYRIGVIVGYNSAPPQPGRGSCIFLHIWAGPGTFTSGCTAMPERDLAAVMLWLDRARRPMLVQMPEADYAAYRQFARVP